MATTTLTLSELFSFDDGTCYEVRCEPWGADPFSGPKDRDWARFQVSEDMATYEWRSGVDLLRAAASDFRAERRTAAEIGADPGLKWWFEQMVDTWLDGIDADEREEEPSYAEIVAEILMGIEHGSLDIDAYDGPSAYHYFEWDNFFSDAAHALELPPWATLETGFGGGPGSGYDQPCIVLAKGRTLAELEGWLGEALPDNLFATRLGSEAHRRPLHPAHPPAGAGGRRLVRPAALRRGRDSRRRPLYCR